MPKQGGRDLSCVSVVTAALPTRPVLLRRCRVSVWDQTHPPAAHIVVYDQTQTPHRGEAEARNRGLDQVETEWTAFCDDDDYLYPEHLELLVGAAEQSGADVVYPWFNFPEYVGQIGFWDNVEGVPFENVGALIGDGSLRGRDFLYAHNFIPVAYLVRTSLARKVGGFPMPHSERWPNATCVDWGFHRDLIDADAGYTHVPVRTWVWDPSEYRNAYGGGDR